MNSYVCKSNNKDVKLKFVEKNGKIFLEVINIEKNNRLNCWNIQQLKLVNDKIDEKNISTYIDIKAPNNTYRYEFETERNLIHFWDNFDKMKGYKKSVIFYEGTNKIHFIGSFVPSKDGNSIESSGEGEEYYLSGSIRYKGETYKGTYSGVGTFLSKNSKIVIKFFEIFDGAIEAGAEAEITFVPSNTKYDIKLEESQTLDIESFDITKFALKYVPELKNVYFNYLPHNEQIICLHEKIEELKKQNLELEDKINDIYYKYDEVKENLLFTKFYGFGVMMIFQAIIYGVVLLK